MGNRLLAEMWRGCALLWHIEHWTLGQECKHRKVISGATSFNVNNDIITNNTRESTNRHRKLGTMFFFLESNPHKKRLSMNYCLKCFDLRKRPWSDRKREYRISSYPVHAFLMPVTIVFYEFIISNLNESASWRQWKCETVFFFELLNHVAYLIYIVCSSINMHCFWFFSFVSFSVYVHFHCKILMEPYHTDNFQR